MKYTFPIEVDVPETMSVGQMLEVLRAMKLAALKAGASELALPSNIGEILRLAPTPAAPDVEPS